MDIRELLNCDAIETHQTLGWALIEFQLMYFEPDRVHETWKGLLTIENKTYDTLEETYKQIGDLNGIENSALSVGFPFDKPSGRLVLTKYSEKRGGEKGNLPTLHYNQNPLEGASIVCNDLKKLFCKVPS